MKFEKFLLDNYSETKEGKFLKQFFFNFKKNYDSKKAKLFKTLYDQIAEDKAFFSTEIISDDLENIQDLFKEFKKKEKLQSISSMKDAEKLFVKFIMFIQKTNELEDRDLLVYVSGISFAFHSLYPEYFFPYFFISHFYKLEEIFFQFDILLPKIPSKKKYTERCLYYLELCKVLYDFRIKYDMSPEELNLFLYGFSLKFLTKYRTDNLPLPSKVYITGATEDDVKEIYKSKNDMIERWAGNESTQPGDIILIYGVSPFSGIISIWRAISKGYIDPFDYWMNRVWVSNRIIIPIISVVELRNDAVWSKKGLVKASMQGVNGVPCSREEYEAIVNILKTKKFDITKIPTLPKIGLEENIEVANEKEVEEKLVEPFLIKLGYTKKDWQRQIPVRMGRGERVYPDYAIFPKLTKGEESCDFIWEAKFRIINTKQLKEAFFQAKSYALRLNAKGLGLIAQEGIWLSLLEDSFSFEKIIFYDWKQVNDFDSFSKIKLKFGKTGKRFE